LLSPIRQVPRPRTGMVAPEGSLQERIRNIRRCNAGAIAYLSDHAGLHSAQYAAGRQPGYDE
jgi:hypothetical protein